MNIEYLTYIFDNKRKKNDWKNILKNKSRKIESTTTIYYEEKKLIYKNELITFECKINRLRDSFKCTNFKLLVPSTDKYDENFMKKHIDYLDLMYLETFKNNRGLLIVANYVALVVQDNEKIDYIIRIKEYCNHEQSVFLAMCENSKHDKLYVPNIINNTFMNYKFILNSSKSRDLEYIALKVNKYIEIQNKIKINFFTEKQIFEYIIKKYGIIQNTLENVMLDDIISLFLFDKIVDSTKIYTLLTNEVSKDEILNLMPSYDYDEEKRIRQGRKINRIIHSGLNYTCSSSSSFLESIKHFAIFEGIMLNEIIHQNTIGLKKNKKSKDVENVLKYYSLSYLSDYDWQYFDYIERIKNLKDIKYAEKMM